MGRRPRPERQEWTEALICSRFCVLGSRFVFTFVFTFVFVFVFVFVDIRT